MSPPMIIKYLDEAIISDSTSVAIKKTTWDKLNKKRRCGESFDEVINRVMIIGGEPL